jgi:hypothetical protein
VSEEKAIQATKSQNGLSDIADADNFHFPYKKTNLGAGLDVSLSLLELLCGASCSKAGPHSEVGIRSLGRNDQERREIEALILLWRSLHCPTSKFWHETRVFVNRIVGLNLPDSSNQNPATEPKSQEPAGPFPEPENVPEKTAVSVLP